MIKKSISKLIEGKDLSMDEAMEVMEIIMDGDATSAQIAAFITALRVKGETPEEIAGMASIMRNKSVSVQVNKPVLSAIPTASTSSSSLTSSTTPLNSLIIFIAFL